MEIRNMLPADYHSVRALGVAAFEDPTIGDLLDDLRDSWAWEDELSFVADADGEVVGHVLYTHGFVDTPSRLVDVLILSPLAVADQRQGRGVGTRLVTATLEIVGDRSEPLVFLEGDPRYYRRFGFESASELGFEPPSERIPDAAFMAFRLPEYRSWMTGRLVYPDPFWRNDAVGLRPDR